MTDSRSAEPEPTELMVVRRPAFDWVRDILICVACLCVIASFAGAAYFLFAVGRATSGLSPDPEPSPTCNVYLYLC